MNLTKAMEYVYLAQATYTLTEYEHGALFEFLSHENYRIGSNIVEVGCCYGRTSLLLAYIAQQKKWKFTAIDAFILSTEAEYLEVMDESKLPYNLIVGRTSPALIPQRPGMREVEWNQPIHFLLIDASHNEPWFSSDCEKWIPHIVHGGIVAFDDWADPNLTEEEGNPHWAVAHYGEIYTKDWIDLGWVGRLRIKRKR